MQFYDNLLGHNLSDPNLQLNKRGHRCKEIEDINFHNYILFTGDNVALDFKYPIEETYPYLISKRLKVDYYNLAIFNGGLDTLKYNLLAWYSKYPKPKFVVISNEFFNSLLTANNNGDDLKVADYKDEVIQSILESGERFGFFPARQILARNILVQHITSPIYQIILNDKPPLFTEDVFDIVHKGDMFDHNKITDLVVQHHNQHFSRALP